MERSFQHLWQDEGLSDVDIQLVLEGTADQPKPKQLAKVPAHRVLLSLSPMLRAQLLRWDTYRQKPPTSKPADQKPAPDQNDDNSKPQIVLTLQDPEQQPAALAVLKSLYATKPLPELLAELPQEQQLQAAVLADMWEVPVVSTAVVDSLTSCAADSNLSDKAAHGLLAMPAHPDCLQPLVKCVLMSKLGDLEAAWADAALQEMLLRLPLHLMEQLLSYDDIQVHSEETVLYTAQEYVNQLPQQAQQTAANRLAPLIRCPHLSTFWLSTSAVSGKAAQTVLYSQHTHIQKLVMLRLADQKQPLKQEELQKLLKGAPESWWLKQRAHKKVESVEMTWELDVEQLKAASFLGGVGKRLVNIPAPPIRTPPFRGIAWTLTAQCNRGKHIGIYMEPSTTLPDLFYRCTYSLSVPCIDKVSTYPSSMQCSCQGHGSTWLFPKNMAQGWEEAVWRAAGLPMSGKVAVKLTVTDVALS